MQEIMKAAILITGNEILSGRIADLNVQYIACELSDLGIVLAEVRMVRDAEGEIIDAVNSLRQKYDYIFSTGGIGPTHDDITAAAMAKAFGVELKRNEMAVKVMEQRCRDENRQMHAANYKMAEMPVGAELILNKLSGPPGFKIGNVYVMAGIPNIMRSMFEGIKPSFVKGARFITKIIELEIGENKIATLLEDVNAEYKTLDMGSYPFLVANNWRTNLVIRGQDQALVEKALAKLRAGLNSAGIKEVGL